MRKILATFAMLSTLMLGVAAAQAQQLLLNPGLDVPGLHEMDLATGWTLTEGPLNTEVPPALANSATFATFADRVDDIPAVDEVGLWLRSFAGGLNATAPPTVFAHLTQSVAGVPGLTYNMSAWSRFETHYAGGVANLNDGPPEAVGESTTDGAVSPTNTELALEFLGVGNVVLGSVVKELLADGQMNDGMWRQHFLSGVAPVGTLLVQVRGSMTGGVLNPGINPQSAFLDDFSLTAVIPEPGAFSLAALALAGLAARGRRKYPATCQTLHERD